MTDLASHMKELETPDVVDGETGYQKEFSVRTYMSISVTCMHESFNSMYSSDGPGQLHIIVVLQFVLFITFLVPTSILSS